MPPFPFPLPNTSLLTFSHLFHDPSASYTSQLAEATAARTKLQLSLKTLNDGSPGASALAVLDAVQGYLPHLQSIISSLDSDVLLPKTDLIFPWQSSLTAYSLTPPLLPLPSIYAEHLYVLLVYTLSLSNYAHSILDSLPAFELESKASASRDAKGKGKAASTFPHLTADEEKRTTAGLSRAVDLLCQASGLATHIAEEVYPKLEGVKKSSGRLGKQKWPIEAGPELYRGVSMMLLADAHITAIRKLLLPVLTYSLFAPPGPPLASSHPSSALLSKLYLYTASLYDSARASLKTHNIEIPTSSKKLFSRDRDKDRDRDHQDNDTDSMEEGVISPLKRYLIKESMLSASLARKWLGIEVGESKDPKIGEAISWLGDSLKRLEAMDDSVMRSKFKNLSGLGKSGEKKKEQRSERKGRVERELEDVKAWLSSYKAMNDRVTFQPVPDVSSLALPSGRPIFTSKAFTPPKNSFGPSLQAEGEGKATETTENYAGKGNYF